MQQPIPVNIFTGFLGSGKTTIILNLLKQLPHPEKVVWLKNEYGDVNIDKLLVQETNVRVSEILNGCLCCVLVGRLGNALHEILENYKPERIIIETSGTAYPAPIVWEVKKIPELFVDSVINIVDALNFSGYDDISYSAELQSKYNDLIVINKYPQGLTDGSSEELALEKRLDDVYALNLKTPKVKTIDGNVDYKLLIGIDSTTLQQLDKSGITEKEAGHGDHQDEVEVVQLQLPAETNVTEEVLQRFCQQLLEKKIIRIKGVVNTASGPQLFNWVFGRGDWRPVKYSGPTSLVFMGKNLSKQADWLRAEFAEEFSV
jgi:G3E family GTPase